MKCFAAASFILLLSFFTANCVAQVVSQTQPPPYGDYQNHLPGLEDPWYSRTGGVRIPPLPRIGPTPEPRVLKKGPLAPSVEDRQTYAGFLKAPDTGLIRLLLPFAADPEKPVKRLKVMGGGAYYSFVFHSHDYLGDLALRFDVNCQGIIGGPPRCQYTRKLYAAIFGMLTNLGNVPLDDIMSNDHRAAFLLAYEPPRDGRKVRCDMLEFRKGVTADGQFYQAGLPIEVNSTYLLRSTDHRTSDLLVAFRVVRQDNDGSVTLAWKLLKEFKPRKIENVLYVNSIDTCPIK